MQDKVKTAWEDEASSVEKQGLTLPDVKPLVEALEDDGGKRRATTDTWLDWDETISIDNWTRSSMPLVGLLGQGNDEVARSTCLAIERRFMWRTPYPFLFEPAKLVNL